MVALRDTHGVGDALHSLAQALESLELGPDSSLLDADRARLVSTIRSYLIPRAFDASTPLTVVLAGPTGSGKSTLINSLTRRDLAATGALRPTTTQPLILTSLRLAGDYESLGGVPCRVVTGEAPVLADMVLVDTPDIDSVVLSHRASAETLIDHADVVVFVTSALRYADDLPWQVLRRAEARGAEVINVLNRVSSATAGAIVDFKARLRTAGLDDDVVTVPEHHLPETGSRVPSTAVRALAKRLATIASDREQHSAETFDRVLRSVVLQTTDLTRRIDELGDETDSLEAELSLYLSDRVSRIDMAGISEGLYAPPPEKIGRWARRRWRMANRLEPEDRGAREQVMVDRFGAVVLGDLRRWIADERVLGFGPGDLVPELLPMTRSAAEGWILYASRLVEETAAQDQWLTEVALIDSATGATIAPAAEILLGDEASDLVHRVRHELRLRLDMVYQHAGSHLVEMIRRSTGSLDVSGLRTAVGVVSATLAPVDA